MKNFLYTLVQIGLTVSLAALIPIALHRVLGKRYPARAMCFVWAVLAARVLIPFQITVPEPPVQVTPRTNYVLHEPNDVPALSEKLTVPETPRWVTNEVAESLGNMDEASVTTFDVVPFFSAVWLIGMAGFLIWQLGCYAGFRKKLRHKSHESVNPAFSDALETQRTELGIKRKIPLMVSAAADGPMLVGFINPALFIPEEEIRADDAEFIFRHELTHLKHGDLWLKLLLVFARSVQWFNPLIHLMAHIAQEDIELACDDSVSNGMDAAQKRAYGESILRAAAAKSKRRALVSCWKGEKEVIMRRFEGLFDKSVKRRGLALVLVTAIMVLSVGAAFSIGNNSSLSEEERTSLAEEWAENKGYETYTVKSDKERTWIISDQPEEALGGYGASDAAVTGIIGGADGPTAIYLTDNNTSGSDALGEADYSTFDAASNEEAALGTIGGADGPTAVFTTGSGIKRRVAQEVHFKNGAVSEADALDSEKTVARADSLEHFKLLFENDLGMPNPVTALADELDSEYDPENVRDIQLKFNLLNNILQLEGASYMGGPADAKAEGFAIADKPEEVELYVVGFEDGSELELITYKNTFFAQDWMERENHANNRTTADLARQFARGVRQKLGQYVYPILSKDLQEAYIEHQKYGGNEWYWKLGGSSPSYRDFILVPTENADTYTIVFQRYGGGINDDRTAYNVTVGKQEGRSVITKVEQCGAPEYTQSELFKLYYDTGLSWPDLNYGGYGEKISSSYNGEDIPELEDPDKAVKAIFGYFGEGKEEKTPEGTIETRVTWFNVDEVHFRTDTVAVALISFTDGSDPVKLRLQKDVNGYWLPTGFVDGNGLHMEVRARTGNKETPIPVGKTAEEAMKQEVPMIPFGSELVISFDDGSGYIETDVNENDKPVVKNLPLVPGGDALKPENLESKDTVEMEVPGLEATDEGICNLPLAPGESNNDAAEPIVPGTLIIEDALLNADGVQMYDDKATNTTTLKLENGTARYTIKSNPATLFSSNSAAFDDGELRRLTIKYVLSEVEYTSVAVFRAGYVTRDGYNTCVVSERDYTNNYYGYTLTLPESFVNHAYILEGSEGRVYFGMLGANPEQDTDAIGVAGGIMWVEATPSGLYNEDTYPMPCKKIAERNDMTYYLVFASDVQYDPRNETIKETYSKMSQDANNLGANDFKFLETKDEYFLTFETEERLTELGYRRANAYTMEHEEKAKRVAETHNEKPTELRNYTVIPHADSMSCDIVYSIFDPNYGTEHRRVEHAEFGKTGVDPIKLDESYASSANKGTTCEKFLLFYDNELGLPTYRADEIAYFQGAQKNVNTGAIDLSSPEKGALIYGMSEAYASHKETENLAEDRARVTYEFWDAADPSKMKPSGETLTLEMQAFQMDDTLPKVWLATGWQIGFSDGTGLENYDAQSEYNKVYAMGTDYYQYRTANELLTFLEQGWADEGYSPNIFEELDERYAEDRESFEKALENHSSAADLWRAYQEEQAALQADPEDAVENPVYENPAEGYSITLPASWNGKYVAIPGAGHISFYQSAAAENLLSSVTNRPKGWLCDIYAGEYNERLKEIARNGWVMNTTPNSAVTINPLVIRGGKILYIQCASSGWAPDDEEMKKEYYAMLSDISYINGRDVTVNWEGSRFSQEEIEAAYNAVLDYAKNSGNDGFTVKNLRFEKDTELYHSLGIMQGGVLSDNEGLSVDDVITVMGDAEFGDDSVFPPAPNWSFTLYRGADGKWILENGAYGY